MDSVPLSINDQAEGIVNPFITELSNLPAEGTGAISTSEKLLFIVESSNASALQGVIKDQQIDQHGYKITAEIKGQGKQVEFSSFTSTAEGQPAEWRIDVGDTFKEEGTYKVKLKSMDAARNKSVDQNKVLVQVLAERPVTPEVPRIRGVEGDKNFIFFDNPPTTLTLTGCAQFERGGRLEILD